MDLTKENEKYFLIQRLLLEATKLIRNLFIETWKEKLNTEWTDDESAGNFFLNDSSGKIILESAKFKKQKEELKSGNSYLWDLSLFKVIFANEPFKNTKNTDSAQNIFDVRNKTSHIATYSIDDKLFENLWKELSTPMKKLGFSKSTLNKMKSSIDKNEKNIINEEKVKKFKEEGNQEFNNQNYIQALQLYLSALNESDKLNVSNELTSIIYCNRSLVYLKLYQKSNKKVKKDLMLALDDAQMAFSLNPKWFKSYYRLGQIYKELNDLEKSEYNLQLALFLDPKNKEIKDLMDEVKFKLFEQNRRFHLDEQSMPRSTEETNKYVFDKYVAQTGATNYKLWTELNDSTKKKDPIRANVWLGHEYMNGSEKIEQNYEKAAQYYSKAALAGSADGLYNLGLLTQNGQGVKKDLKAALSYFKQAADQDHYKIIDEYGTHNVGVAESEHYLGVLYQNGIIVEKNLDLAISYYKRSVEHGCPNASNNLGLLYLKGEDLEKDLTLAERYLLYAYKLGDKNAMSNLINLHLSKNDPDNALVWHQRAIDYNSLKDIGRDEEIRKQINHFQLIRPLIVTNKQETNTKKSILIDPNRIDLIKSHRKHYVEKVQFWKNIKSNVSISLLTTIIAPKKQNVHLDSLKSFTDITDIKFNGIDFKNDHILKGFKISITIIDVPVKNSHSFLFIVEDEEKFIERMSVYNLPDEYILNNFKVGSKFIVLEPYIRMAADEKPMIRIDDPKSIITIDGKIKMCRYCGEENSKFLCKNCLDSFYCSKDCQKQDWTLLHKLICENSQNSKN